MGFYSSVLTLNYHSKSLSDLTECGSCLRALSARERCRPAYPLRGMVTLIGEQSAPFIIGDVNFVLPHMSIECGTIFGLTPILKWQAKKNVYCLYLG